MKRLLLPVFLIALIFLPRSIKVNAAVPGWSPPDNYRENESLELRLEESNEDQDVAPSNNEMSMQDIFGDEQVFPFPPGLGN